MNSIIADILGLDPQEAFAREQKARSDQYARMTEKLGLTPVTLCECLPEVPRMSLAEEQRLRSEAFVKLPKDEQMLQILAPFIRFKG